MIRQLTRSVRHLFTAVLLLAALACVAEVTLRMMRVQGRDVTDRRVVVPSAHCYVELKPLAVRSDPTGSQSLRTSSLGTRGPEPVIPKPPGLLRLLVLGDDATLALDQPIGRTFCNRVETQLAARTGRSVEVINAGLPGGCPLLSQLQYRHRLASLRPDAVLLVLDAGDVADDMRVRPQLRLDADGRPIACPHPAMKSDRQTWRSEFVLADLLTRSVASSWLSTRPAVRSDLLCPERRLEWARDPNGWAVQIVDMLTPIKTLHEEVRADGATFHLTAMPTASSSQPGGANPWRLIGQFALSEQIDWFDVSEGMARQSQADAMLAPAPTSCGRLLLTPVGHDWFADAITRHLTAP